MRHEELCVEYVAKTRARRRLVYLPHVDVLTRQSFLKLFEPDEEEQEAQAVAAMASSQDTNSFHRRRRN